MTKKTNEVVVPVQVEVVTDEDAERVSTAVDAVTQFGTIREALELALDGAGIEYDDVSCFVLERPTETDALSQIHQLALDDDLSAADFYEEVTCVLDRFGLRGDGK